jgi:hypothetical protein
MFNFSLYPYARWLGDGSLDGVPSFNIGESEVPPGNGASGGGMFAAPPMPQYPSWPRTLGSTGGTGGLRQRLSVDPRNGLPPMLRGSEVLGPNAPNRIRAARGSISYRERASHPDS